MKHHRLGLQAEKLTIRRGRDHAILNEVSVRFEPGTLTAIIGPSGAGKSTLLRTLGLQPPSRRNQDRGLISLIRDNQSLPISGANHQTLLDVLAYVPQQDHFADGARVREVIEDALTFAQRPASRKQLTEIMSAVGLPGDDAFLARSVALLSGGELRRLTLARALCPDPSIILLDEPTSGLDIPVAHEVMELLQRLSRDRGLTIVTTSHLPETLAVCDRTFVLGPDGRFLAEYANASTIDARTAFHEERPLRPVPSVHDWPVADLPQKSRDGLDRHHFWSIARRSLRQWWRDRPAAATTLVLPLALAAIIVFTQILHGSLAPRFINFFLTIAALWIGMSLTVREIVSTRRLYAIDELGGLGKFSYFGAKLAVATLMSLASTILLCASAWFFIKILKVEPDAVLTSTWFDARDFVSHVLILGLVCFSGAMVGLILSTLSHSERGAISLMPLVLLPHVLFSKYATGYAAEASANALTHPFHSLAFGQLDLSRLSGIELGNFWISLLASTRHATACFDELGSGYFRFTHIFNLDFGALALLGGIQTLLALLIFAFSANRAIHRIR